MISKRVFSEAKNDSYAQLASYITDAGPEGEKCLMSWCEGTLGGDDYAEGIAEAVDVQTKNIRAASKTYHLVISFRPEDETKLTLELFKSIEERFASALGYSDHQRHCGVHKNTDNLHIHVAYNMIHPETYTHHKEFRDFWIRDKVCREIERDFGLTIDPGIEQKPLRQSRNNEKAQLVEAYTGQQSFDSYAKEHRAALMPRLEAATSWQELHIALAEYGIEIKKHGSGLAIKDRHSKGTAHSIKASALDRSLSIQKLEDRLGAYQPPQSLKEVQERTRYVSAPLHRSPERGQLFTDFKAGIEARKTILQDVKEREDAALADIRAEWAAKRQELESKNIAKKNLRRLLQIARKHEAEALAKAKQSFQEPRNAVRQEIPFTSWNSFLQRKVEQGNETALAVLRSRQVVIEPETNSLAKDWSAHGQARAEYAAKERAVLEMDAIGGKAKSRLQSILRMEQVTDDFRHHVDRKGIVVFTLQDGSTVRDSGKEILFSVNNKRAETIALQYARKKWGKDILMDTNKITRKPFIEHKQAMER